MSYNEHYYANFADLTAEEYANKYIRSNEQEMRRIYQMIDFLPTDVTSVLDVGAGFGILLEELETRRGIKGIGIEITDAKIEYAQKRGIDMRKGDAAKLDFPDDSFDVVVACEVLEHLPFGVFERALTEFVRVSRKYIVISVPFKENRVFIKCPYCGASVNPNYHMREFDESSLSDLFSNARLERTMLIGRIVTVPLQRWLGSRRKHITWPPFLVCPCCGYKNTNSSANSAEEDVLNDRFGSSIENILKKTAKKLLVLTGKHKPQWIVGLYTVGSDASQHTIKPT